MPHVSDVLSSRDIAKFSNLQVLARGVVEGFCSGLLVPMTTDQPYADSLAAYLALRRKGTVMTFLNGALAFGTLAFLIPLIIHILNRSAMCDPCLAGPVSRETCVDEQQFPLACDVWEKTRILMLSFVNMDVKIAG